METSIGLAGGAWALRPPRCRSFRMRVVSRPSRRCPETSTHTPLTPVDGALPVRPVVPDADLLDRYQGSEQGERRARAVRGDTRDLRPSITSTRASEIWSAMR